MNVCYGVKGPLTRIMPKTGLTAGGTILLKKQKKDIEPAFLAHEVSHGSQFAALGPAFLPSYVGGEIGARVTGQCNPLERYANHGRAFGC